MRQLEKPPNRGVRRSGCRSVSKNRTPTALQEYLQASSMEQIVDGAARDSVANERLEAEGILCVFRGFQSAQLRQKIRRRPQTIWSEVLKGNLIWSEKEKRFIINPNINENSIK